MLSRREFAAIFSVGGLAAASGPARADDTDNSTLKVAFDGAAVTSFVLDPHNCLFAPQARILRSIFDNLVVLREDQSLGPWLANDWQISKDRTQYIFTLREGVVFHDGTKFDANAVKANFDRIRDPKNALLSLPEIGPYSGATILNDHQVKLEFATPFEPFLRNASAVGLAIVSPAAVQKYGKAFSQNPVGSGPFSFTALTAGAEIRLARNEAYQWAPSNAAHTGPALLKNLIFADVPEQLTRVAALQSGQVQVADLIPSQVIPAFKANPDFKFLQKEMLDTNFALMPNVTQAPWDDRDIREAVRLSLDVDQIVRVIYRGTIERAWSPLSHKLFGSAETELVDSWKPDANRAKAILDAKGWHPGPDGIRVKNQQRLAFNYIDMQGNREQRMDVIQLVRHQLAASGIDLVIITLSQGNYFQRSADNDFSLAAGGQYAPDPDVLRLFFVPDERSPFSPVKTNDPELSELLKRGLVEADPKTRADIYIAAQKRIIEQVYLIPIYILRYNLSAASNVNGVALDAHGFPVYHAAKLTSA